jgi:hypothetical protein
MLTEVSALVQQLSPGRRGFVLAIAVVAAALLAAYAGLFALIVATVRNGRSLRNIEQKLK